MRYVYLLGYPLTMSWSPVLHQAAFSHCGLEGEYGLKPVPPAELAQAVGELRRDGILGANVTTPHKQSVIPLLDELDSSAREVEAVNTIVTNNGRLYGYNTDIEGAHTTLKAIGSVHKRVVLLGAGGAARAVLQALAPSDLRPSSVIVINRSASRLTALNHYASTLPYSIKLIPAHSILSTTSVDSAELIIHCSSDPAWWRQWEIKAPVWDLNYGEKSHSLRDYCKQSDIPYTDGRIMLVSQARASFFYWTGRNIPIEIMAAALNKALAEVES